MVKNNQSKAPVSPVPLISEARLLGFYGIDTAPVYGEAEQKIGEAGQQIGDGEAPLAVYTKLHPAMSVEDSIQHSLVNLQRKFLDGVYLHEEYVASFRQKEMLKRVGNRKSRDVGAVGVSVYSIEEFLRANDNPDIDVIQLPFNVLDSRFNAQFLNENLDPEKTVVGRSVFLQGVLLQPARKLPRKVAHLRRFKQSLEEWTSDSGLDYLDVALGYAVSNQALGGIVVGVSSVDELREIAARKSSLAEKNLGPVISFFNRPAWSDVDPRTWKER